MVMIFLTYELDIAVWQNHYEHTAARGGGY